MKKIIFEKRQLKLIEDELTFNSDSLNNGTNINKEANVTPSATGSSNISSDLNTAKSDNPEANTFNVNLSNYADKNKSVTPTIANFNVNGASDASKTIDSAIKSNPQLAAAVNNGTAIGKIHMKGASTNLGESINFTKKELDNFLKKL